jgi:hypothetical protein
MYLCISRGNDQWSTNGSSSTDRNTNKSCNLR